MNYHDMAAAVYEAEQTEMNFQCQISALAYMVSRNLRSVSKYSVDRHRNHQTLCKLKRELSQYNCKTGEWKN